VTQNRTPRAHLFWSSPSAEAFADAEAALARAGYRLDCAPGRADLALFDAREGAYSARAAKDAAARLRESQTECGIVFLGSSRLSGAERAHLRRHGELVLAGGDLAPLVSACRQRLRIRNLAEETGERLKSIAAQTRLSEFAPIDTSNEPPSLLIAGAPGSAMLSIIAAAAEVCERCEAAMSSGQAMRALETGLYDCLAIAPKDAGDPLLGLVRALRRHRRLNDLPILIVRPTDRAHLDHAAPPNAELMFPEHVSADLGRRVVQLTRRSRLVAAMRRFLTTSAGEGVRDRISGAFTSTFFGWHGARVLARADETGRAASLAAIRLAPKAASAPYGAAVRPVMEAARLLHRVTRAEDCVGMISQDTFVVLASATTGDDAWLIARRAEGVIANTMFRSRASPELYAVAATTAAVERARGRRIEEAVAELLAALKARPPRTIER
jgi:PleD family two-component response regulator